MEKEVSPQQKYLFLSHFDLKIIAVILMTLDHAAIFFVPATSVFYEILRSIGRLSFPLFVFMSVEGVFKSHKPWLYGLKLLIPGLFIDLVLFLTMKIYPGNAFVELSLGVIGLYLLERKDKFSFLALLPFAIMILSDCPSFFPIRSEYGTFGLIVFLCFYFARKTADYYTNKVAEQMKLPFEAVFELKGRYNRNLWAIFGLFVANLILLAIYFLNPASFVITGLAIRVGIEEYSALAGLFIFFYSGKKGYSNSFVNYAFYAYYPLHMLVLYLIYYLVNL
ncbi:MAG: conjugal transfer protein TraX [Bacilli bacterium]|jgi:hypothetical protein|nr:conjugal transfer protein TraX [Bacilli bacterium]